MAIDLFSIGPVTLHGYGLMIGLGFAAAVIIGCLRAKKLGLSQDHFTSIAIYVLIFGFCGGKLLHVITSFGAFLQNPLQVLGSEGFVVYGGIITGVLTIILYCRIKKISALEYLDLLSPSVAINQALGRIGCFMAGCCYGKETDSAWGVIFPEGCLAPAGVKVLPTQLFSAAGDLVLFGILLYVAKKRKTPGMVSGVYILAYSIGRFIVEIFRDDPRGNVGMLSTSQFIAIWTCIAAIAYIVCLKKCVKVGDDAATAIENAKEGE